MHDGKIQTADWFFRMLLIALVLMWAAFPPQPSAPALDAGKIVAESPAGGASLTKLVP